MIAYTSKDLIDPYLEISSAVWENFEKSGTRTKFPKETILKAANTTEKYFNFIIEGSGGSLLWREDNFVCTGIVFENNILNDCMSFTMQKATPVEVRLFEDSVIFRISHENFQNVFKQGNYAEAILKIATEASYIEKQQQQIDLLTKTAQERYIELLKGRKGMDRIPPKYLASYLGITVQSLGRMKAEKV